MKRLAIQSFIILFTCLTTQIVLCQRDSSHIENLGPNVNSIWDERAPVISPDGKILYFTRGGHPENLGASSSSVEQDIWYSKLGEDGRWSEAVNIGPPLNSPYPNSICSVTPDGNTVVLMGAYRKDRTSGPGYSISHRTAEGWSFPEKINIKGYYNQSHYSNLYMNNDGNVLLLALQRNNSIGLKDIYVSFNEGNNNWSMPLNLGPVINTTNEEYSPFLASDGVSLYFSSKGHQGHGGYDVFVSRRLDSSWQNWSRPENLGNSINSPKDELFFKIPSSGDFIYFLSYSNSYGQGDIFRTLLPDKLRPKPVALVSGKVFFYGTEDPLNAMIFYELMPDFKEVGVARTNPKTGEYKIALPLGAKYRFYASATDFLSHGGDIDLTAYDKYSELERNIELSPIETGQVMSLDTLYFETETRKISEEKEYSLDLVILFLNGNPNAKIEIQSFPSYEELKNNNSGYALERANLAAKYIISSYISKSRVLIDRDSHRFPNNPKPEKGSIIFKIIR